MLLGAGTPAPSATSGIATIADAVAPRGHRRDRRSAPARDDQRPAHHDPPRRGAECSPASSRSSAPSPRVEDQGDAVRLTVRAATVTRATPGSATRSPSTAAASPSPTRDGDTFTADVMQRDPGQDLARRPGARRPGQPRARGHADHPARRPHRAGPRRRHRHGRCAVRPASTGRSSRSRCRPSSRRYLVDKGSITVDGVSLTVVEVGADGVHRQPDPRDPGPHHAGLPAARRPASTSRSTSSPSTSRSCVDDALTAPSSTAMTERSGSTRVERADRRHRRRQGRGRRRRRGPRERGRHHLRRQQGDARS